MDPAAQIASLESRLLDLTARLDQIDKKDNVGFYEIPQEDFEPGVPLAQEVNVISATQAAQRTDLVVGWSNPDPGRIARFELWAVNVTGQSKEPYLVASVDNSPASFSLEASEDTSVAVHIRTIARDGLSSTLAGSPTIGASIVKQPVTDITIADGSVGDAKLDRVTDPIIIDTADIANAAIGTAQIANLAVDTAQIANSAIGTAQVGSLNASVITAGSLAAGVAVLGTVLAGQVQAGTLSSVNISAGTYTLSSGANSFKINSTDGFYQENTSGTVATQIDDGVMKVFDTASNPKRFFAAKDSFGIIDASSQNLFTVDHGTNSEGRMILAGSGGATYFSAQTNSGGRADIDINGSVTWAEQSTTPANPTSANEMRVYMKGDNFVIQYNDGGTVRYKYLDLTGTGVTWTHSTTAP